MKALLSRAIIGIAFLSASACSNPVDIISRTPASPQPGKTASATPTPTPAPTTPPSPTATPTPTTAPNSVSTTTTIGNGAAISNAPLATSVPAPAGYTQAVSVPLVDVPAGAEVTLSAGPSAPAQLVPLGSRRLQGARRTAQAGTFDTIFYDSIMPSANITVAGNISFTQSFPGGGLTAGTQYYLAFYDTTQASPAWQTIAGPVSPSGAGGANLTFSGTVSSFTLQAGKLYGFATFSTATPSATPPPAPQTLLYFGNGTGLTIANESGVVQTTLAIPSESFDLDDAGNIYAYDPHHGGPSPGTGGSPQLAEFPAGSATASTIYTPSINDNMFVSASGAGELAAIHSVSSSGTLSTDVWDLGKSGAPSRTIVTSVPTGIVSFAMAHDGTLYLPDRSSAGVPQYDVIPPGSSTPSSIIAETIIPASQYNNFSANYAAVGADGTLYVTEYTFNQPDPNAGLYIYPVNGPERFIATPSNAQGPGPQGVDVDASNTIYVVNNNTGTTSDTTCQGDSLQSVTVYNQMGTLLRTVTGGINSGFPITVAADGTAFVSSFQAQLLPGCSITGSDDIYSIAPGAPTLTQIASSGSTEIVLYDGTHKTEPFSRSAHIGGGSGARGAWVIRRPARVR